MRRGTTRVAERKSVKPEPKHFTPERLAERVFIDAPRTFSFSHRALGSLRHPYLPFVVDLVENMPPSKRVGCILESLLDAKNEAEKWKRVSVVFDAKVEAPELDKRRMDILVSTDVMSKVEATWSLLGGTQDSFLAGDVYRQFHARLYAMLLSSDDVSLTAATITAVNEDYAHDARDYDGVSYGSFALSLLEIADNWTKSRSPADFAAFLQQIVDTVGFNSRRVSAAQQPISTTPTDFSISDNVFFSGGVLAKHQVEDHVEYAKVPM